MRNPGDPTRGWRDLTDRALSHADALHRLARHLAATPEEAEDLVQETYARAFAAAGQLADAGSLKAWLFQILRNTFLSRVRRERRGPVELVEDPEAAGEDPADDAWLRGDVELEAMRRLVAGEIEAALRTLGPDARTVVLLDVEGFTEGEMAEVLGCPPGTVKSRLSRARAALRERLAGYAHEVRP